MVAGLKGRTYEQKLVEVGLTTLEERRVRGDMIQTFMILNGIDQVEPGTWLGAANTRYSSDYTMTVEGASKTELRRNYFSQRVTRPWNSLPQSTRQQPNVLGFKAAYDGTPLWQPG